MECPLRDCKSDHNISVTPPPSFLWSLGANKLLPFTTDSRANHFNSVQILPTLPYNVFLSWLLLKCSHFHRSWESPCFHLCVSLAIYSCFTSLGRQSSVKPDFYDILEETLGRFSHHGLQSRPQPPLPAKRAVLCFL